MKDTEADLATQRSVAMLCDGDEAYGVGTIVRLYARAMPALQFVCMREGKLSRWLRSTGARVVVMPGFTSFYAQGSVRTALRIPAAFRKAEETAERLHRLLGQSGISVLHTHWLPQQMIAGVMRRRFGYRAVWQLNNNTDPRRLFGLGPRLNQLLARWGADVLLPASNFIAGNWRGCGVPIRTIHNAAEPLFEASNVVRSDQLKCLVAGRLDESKGHHLAVAAVLAARKAGLDARLDIFGGPVEGNPYADRLRAQIADAVAKGDANAAEAIRLCGFQADLRSRHQHYDIGMQCRIDPEPCSLWVCETLVDGLPLLASATGGTPELIEDGLTGLLFRGGDDKDLAAKLMLLARDPRRLSGMRVAAFERGRKLFRIDRFVDQTLAAYRVALSRRPVAG